MDPVNVYTVEHLLQALVVVGSIFELIVKFVGIIQSYSLFQPQFVGGMKQMVAGKVGNLQADAGFCRHAQASFFGLFGDDDDDAVGTTRTVDGCGSGIFQDVDALDLVIVVVHELGQTDLEAVKDDERRVDGLSGIGVELLDIHRQGRSATDVNVGQYIGVAARNVVDREVERSVHVLQRLQQVAATEHLQLFLAYGGDGTGIALLGFAEDAGDDNLADLFDIRLQSDVHHLGHLHHAGLHAHIADLCRLTATQQIVEAECAVDICHGGDIRTKDSHLCSYHRLFGLFVKDISADRLQLAGLGRL